MIENNQVLDGRTKNLLIIAVILFVIYLIIPGSSSPKELEAENIDTIDNKVPETKQETEQATPAPPLKKEEPKPIKVKNQDLLDHITKLEEELNKLKKKIKEL
eukprot:TRINITY_DN12214_c0_g1_i1.p1 TRINITY_DN12214_c0_g1~~TRINITY_DN12214_c0_g1_i1.p1  ORF type:complete len:103 (-),score=35.21 TRINITY_DN12214_c0_g1_i1:10-318(-)